ncbi:MAG: YraN family protein [Fibrobacterota bacterium]
MNSRAVGTSGENRAVQYLLRRGYALLARNWAYRTGEIDLICRAPSGQLVFVEVKHHRSPELYGGSENRVSPKKLSRIAATARLYIRDRGLEHFSCRIDVIAINGESLSHFENCLPP